MLITWPGLVCARRPAKVTGSDHPDVIVETATLASVEPPNPTYTVHKGVQVRGRHTAAEQHAAYLWYLCALSCSDGHAAGPRACSSIASCSCCSWR